jgi:hypothetical protein
MICHGELAKRQPNKNKLTLFYLVLALGGVIGSLFTAIIAEHIFNQYYELIVGIVLTYILFAISLGLSNKNNDPSHAMFTRNKYLAYASCTAVVCFGFYFNQLNSHYFQTDLHNSRNFYGVLAVKMQTRNNQPVKVLLDGVTDHGSQSQNPSLKNSATSYYRAGTGIALALDHINKKQANKVGIIGLGTGTLATYAKHTDEYVFYELNPAVAQVASQHFSYLADSKAHTQVKLGDARITLHNELNTLGGQNYDALIVDAFSSDSIPVHLLTLEAFELYWQHIKSNGLLVMHISNNHLDLLPLINNLAVKLNIPLRHFILASNDPEQQTTQWVVLTQDRTFLQDPSIQIKATYLNLKPNKHAIWTDKYSNLLSVIKF